MADVESIMSLMMDQEPPLSEVDYSYAKKEWLWVPDNNGGSYGSGQITFDLKAQQSKFIDWSEAFLRIPYVLESAGAAYTAADAQNIAIRNGGAAIIQDIQVQVNGVTVENTLNVNLAAGVRNLFAPSEDYVESHGRQVMLGLDTAPVMTNAAISAPTAAPTAEQLGNTRSIPSAVYAVVGDGVGGNILATNPYSVIAARLSSIITSEGKRITFASSTPAALPAGGGDSTTAFIESLRVIQADVEYTITAGQNTNLTTSTIAALAALIEFNARPIALEVLDFNRGRVARTKAARWSLVTTQGGNPTYYLKGLIDVPLKHLSGYFRSLTGVSTNLYHNIRIQMANGRSTMGPVHVVGGTSWPILEYANLFAGVGSGGVRLYYPEVKPATMLASTIADKLQAPGGWVKNLKFRDFKVFQNQGAAGGLNARSSETFYITPSILRARRLFIWATPRIRFDGTDNVRALQAPISCGLFTQCPLNNFQVSIDNTPYYAQPIDSDHVAYQYVRDAFESHGLDNQRGTQLSFDMWRSYYRYYVVDLSRGSETFDIGRPVQIQASFAPMSGEANYAGTGSDVYNPNGNVAFAVDAYALVEVDSHVTLNLTSGAVSAIIQ